MPEKCFKCLKQIIPPTPIKRHNGDSFHPNCFNCSSCSQPITGSKFFPEPLRCLNCLEQVGPKCHGCNLSFDLAKLGMFSYKKLSNEEKYFHNECFVCSKCKSSATDGFYERAGLLICISCKNEEIVSNSKKCEKCEGIVTMSSVDYQGKTYHKDCLRCILCDEELDKKYYICGDLQPVCEKCNRNEKLKNARECAKCKDIITESGVGFLDKDYHENCLTCSACDKVLKSSNLLTNSTKEPYCEDCFTKKFAKTCLKCNQHINPLSSLISFNNFFYHKECLVCDDCNISVINMAFYKKDSRISCKDCKSNKIN
jgi:hypothetical protein